MKKLVRESLNEKIEKDPNLYLTIIRGRVGDKGVIAYLYPGRDSDLSYYKVDGKTYVGTVDFSEIYEKRRKKY